MQINSCRENHLEWLKGWKLNLLFKKPFSLSISAQGSLFLLAIPNATAAALPDFQNYVARQTN